MDSLVRTFFPFLVPALLSLSGCSKPTMDSAKVAEFRTKLTMAEEPAGEAQTVSEVRLAMLGEKAPDVLSLIEHEGEETATSEASTHDHEHAETEHGDHDHADHDHAEPDAHADHDHADHEHEHGDHEHSDHDHADHEHASTGGRDVKEMDVVLVGIVGGIPNPSEQSYVDFPFATDQAMFFLADPEAVAELEEHGHKHAPGEECAFCAAHAADAAMLIAAVQFSDENGKVLPVDARELFDLKEGETVVVRGLAKASSGGILSVDANGLYVRR
jgi:hypothetical protein